MTPQDITQEFLQRYFGTLADDEEVELRFIDHNEILPPRQTFSTSIALLAQTAHKRNAEGYQCYFGPAPRRRGKHNGTAEGLARSRWLWADLDHKDFGGDEEAAKKALMDFTPWPQIVVYSGGGIHAHWRLDAPIEDPSELQGLLVRLALTIGADKKAAKSPQPMRLPGTLNHRYDPPRPAVVRYVPEGQCKPTYRLADFDLVAAPAPPAYAPAYDGPPSELPQVEEALRFIDPHKPSLDYEGWTSILMAIHDADPGPEGLALAEHWGQGKPREIEKKWHSFQKGGRTVGTLFWEAQQRGYVRPKPLPGPVITGPRGPVAAATFRASPPPQGGRLIWLPEFLATPPKPVEWLVEGLLFRGGTSIIAGPPKVGKSFAAINIGFAVAAGLPVLGHTTLQGPAGLVSLEMTKDSPLWFDLDRLAPAYGSPHDWGFIDRTDQVLLANPYACIEKIVREQKPALLILDTLWDALEIPEINDYATVKATLARVAELAREGPTHIMMIHHTNKGVGGGMNRLIGSVAFQGGVDMMIQLHDDPEIGGLRLEHLPRWGAKIPDAAAYMDDTRRQLHLIDSNRDKAALHAVGQQILAYLSTCAGREAPERDLRGALLSEAGTISKALGALDAAHRISRADGKVKLFAWMPTAHHPTGQLELETGD